MSILESVPSTNVKIIELYNKIDSGSLVINPAFQRKLVWKKQHKYHFIETILKNYPFPEVYIASSEMDVSSIKSSEVVVDGQQRLSTIVDYIRGQGDFSNQNRIRSFSSLSTEEKKYFLNYFVSVRDLKDTSPEVIKDIFKRINNTEYSLNAIEKINAQYGDSEFIIYCKQLVDNEYNPTPEETEALIPASDRELIFNFFNEHEVFSETDVRRMNNLQFAMTLVATLLESEYFTRNDKVINYIEKYNNEFELKDQVTTALVKSIASYKELKIEKESYWFSKSNTFTLIIELSKHNKDKIDKNTLKRHLDLVEANSKKYFSNIEIESIPSDQVRYFEYAKEAVNARKARVSRGEFVGNLIEQSKP